jgi:hypothetical protein
MDLLQRPHSGKYLSHLRFPTRHILQTLGVRCSSERQKLSETRWIEVSTRTLGVGTRVANVSDSNTDIFMRGKKGCLISADAHAVVSAVAHYLLKVRVRVRMRMRTPTCTGFK